jgi:hypothetical protein
MGARSISVALSLFGLLLQFVGALRLAEPFASSVRQRTIVCWMLKFWQYATRKSTNKHYKERLQLEDLNSSIDLRARAFSGLFFVIWGCVFQASGSVVALFG